MVLASLNNKKIHEVDHAFLIKTFNVEFQNGLCSSPEETIFC